MKRLLWGIMIMFYFGTRVQAQETSAFDLGFHVREGQVLVEKSLVTKKNVGQTTAFLKASRISVERAQDLITSSEAMLVAEGRGVIAQADKIEKGALELKQKSLIALPEFERSMKVVRELRTAQDDLSRLARELDVSRLAANNTTR